MVRQTHKAQTMCYLEDHIMGHASGMFEVSWGRGATSTLCCVTSEPFLLKGCDGTKCQDKRYAGRIASKGHGVSSKFLGFN